MQSKETTGVHIEGHIKIHNPETGEVFINKRNAIHYENISIALAQSLANSGQGFIYEMAFGNGGTAVDPTGIITYLTPNSSGSSASFTRDCKALSYMVSIPSGLFSFVFLDVFFLVHAVYQGQKGFVEI